ncbi:MAG: putative stress-responsive transcriptional regulator [Marmoricola sp.]|nr:putative stress-responsive transcriptional regulator [Marmoricola sp.]
MTNASPSAAPTAVRPELRRSATEKMAGGVCGGLSAYSGIDALLWRVGFVGLTVAGGAGVLVYLLLWVLMPPPVAAQEPASPLDRAVTGLHTRLTGNQGTGAQA